MIDDSATRPHAGLNGVTPSKYRYQAVERQRMNQKRVERLIRKRRLLEPRRQR